MYEGGQVKKSGYFGGSLQFHCYQQISPLIKHSSFVGVKNISVSKIMEIKVEEINAPLNKWHGINVSRN